MSEDYVRDGEYLPAPVEGDYLGSENKPIDVNQSVEAGDVIRTTQTVRLKILKHRLAKGIPSDDKELALDMQLLRDLDNAALTTRKIDVEERAVNESEKVNEHVAALTKMFGGKSPFAIDPATGQVRKDLQNREIEATLPDAKLVPGIAKQGTDNLNYADFVDDPDGDDEKRNQALEDSEEEEEEFSGYGGEA